MALYCCTFLTPYPLVSDQALVAQANAASEGMTGSVHMVANERYAWIDGYFIVTGEAT